MKEAMAPSSTACASCPSRRDDNLLKLGIDTDRWDYVVALAGNPNTGKSTLFNNLTGLRQHTGNWPGKTVTRAEGGFAHGDKRYKVVDLPGTYSLMASSLDEEIARDFILFGRPDVTIVVVDAVRLERNLNLVLQVLEITDRVVVCLNLMDEAERHGIEVDVRQLSKDLGVPVIPTVARQMRGVEDLLKAVREVASGEFRCRPFRIPREPDAIQPAVSHLVKELQTLFPDLPNARWVALRLLDGDDRVIEAVRKLDLGESELDRSASTDEARVVLATAQDYRMEFAAEDLHEKLTEAIFAESTRITGRASRNSEEAKGRDLGWAIDRIVTSRVWGFPLMILLFAVVFWITISGANVPSAMLSTLLIGKMCPALHGIAAQVGFPDWLSGFLIDGVYLATAWVISVMLPPMAIFFPMFTLLEDFGYLPRVAFNLDYLFKRTGAHGKQALSMMMGFGCNAAGVVATRIIDSPRERLIAIITNNFALCNGRWPTQILVATLFVGSVVPAQLAGLISAGAVVGVALFGVFLSFAVSWFLSRTMLRGEVSTFSLELPPYRPPRLFQTLWTSLIDRTMFVLWRAIIFAIPAGAVIWLSANIEIGNASIAEHLMTFMNPVGVALGLNGVILLAYIVAIPANEIVIPTILMLTVLNAGMSGAGEGTGVMFELDSASDTMQLFKAGGWTLLTAVNLMLFSLLHNPCSTTIFTIFKETRSWKWTTVSALLPLGMGLGLTFFVAQIWRLIFGLDY